MPKGLKNELYLAIKNAYPRVFTLEDIEKLTKSGGYKDTHAAARLRDLANKDKVIDSVWNDKGKAIIGYKFKPVEPVMTEIKETAEQTPLFPARRVYN